MKHAIPDLASSTQTGPARTTLARVPLVLALCALCACADDGGTNDAGGTGGAGDRGGTGGETGGAELTGGNGAGPGPGPGTGAGGDAPPPFDAEAVLLRVDEPARGSRVERGPIRVKGVVTGGQAPTLVVNGVSAEIGPAGFFSVEVPVEDGLNILETVITDGASTFDDHRAVVVGPFADPVAPVDRSMGAAVTADGLGVVAGLVADYVSGLDLVALLTPRLPEGTNLRRLDFQTFDLALVPMSGRVRVTATFTNVFLFFDGVAEVALDVAYEGTASASTVSVSADLVLSPAADGGLDIDVRATNAELTDFTYDIEQIPDAVESWFAETTVDLLEWFATDTLNSFVVPALFNQDALSREIEILGRTLAVGLRIDDVATGNDGLAMTFGLVASAPQVVHDGPAVPLLGEASPAPGVRQLELTLAADAVARTLHAAWAGGLLDISLDPNAGFELPFDLNAGFLRSGLGAAAELVDPMAPLRITTQALLPPVVRIEDGELPIVLELGDMLLDFIDDRGIIVTMAVHATVRARLELDGLTNIAPTVEVDVVVDVANAPRGRVDDPRLENLVESVAAFVPSLLADQTFGVGPDVLPVPVELANVGLVADPAGQSVHAGADVSPAQ